MVSLVPDSLVEYKRCRCCLPFIAFHESVHYVQRSCELDLFAIVLLLSGATCAVMVAVSFSSLRCSTKKHTRYRKRVDCHATLAALFGS